MTHEDSSLMKALSVIEPAGVAIAAGWKTLEIRHWRPERLPLIDLAIVRNRRRLTVDDPVDPDGRVVALVDVRVIRPWRREEADAAASTWEPGWLAWELENVRRVAAGPTVPAKRRIYHIDVDLEGLCLERLRVRQARIADASAICDVHVGSIRMLCAEAYSMDQIEAWAGPKRAEHYVKPISEGRLYVAEVDGRIAGFAEYEGDRIHAVYVHPAHVRQGIGTALFHCLTAELRSHGVKRVEFSASLPSVPFYEAMGCVREKEARFRPGAGVEMACLNMSFWL